MLPRVVFIDVDDTIVRSAGSKQIPISSSIQVVRELHQRGVALYLWSSGGAEYAQTTARDLGIEACFVGFLPKPNAIIDDVPLATWPLQEFHPNEAASLNAEEFVAKLVK